MLTSFFLGTDQLEKREKNRRQTSTCSLPRASSHFVARRAPRRRLSSTLRRIRREFRAPGSSATDPFQDRSCPQGGRCSLSNVVELAIPTRGTRGRNTCECLTIEDTRSLYQHPAGPMPARRRQ